jgi:hypothetical protein
MNLLFSSVAACSNQSLKSVPHRNGVKPTLCYQQDCCTPMRDLSACATMKQYGSFSERFWSHVTIKTDNECWPWSGATTGKDGRGQFRQNGKLIIAARVAYELCYGVLLQNLALHKCDNPKCCNPHHLYDGTYADNNRDAVSRGRHVCPRGEDVHFAKLTDNDVVNIRRRRFEHAESINALATEFSVVPESIRSALRGDTFAHLPMYAGITATCRVCGMRFHAKTSAKRTCSAKCSAKLLNREKTERGLTPCARCGKARPISSLLMCHSCYQTTRKQARRHARKEN